MLCSVCMCKKDARNQGGRLRGGTIARNAPLSVAEPDLCRRGGGQVVHPTAQLHRRGGGTLHHQGRAAASRGQPSSQGSLAVSMVLRPYWTKDLGAVTA
jgi:hypothetical protein